MKMLECEYCKREAKLKTNVKGIYICDNESCWILFVSDQCISAINRCRACDCPIPEEKLYCCECRNKQRQKDNGKSI